MIYVDDAVNAIIALIDKENEVFNLGSGQDNSINEFAKIVCDNYDYDYNFLHHDLSKYVGVKEKKIDTAKIDLALFPKKLLNTTLEQGLKKTIKYFINEYEKWK